MNDKYQKNIDDTKLAFSLGFFLLSEYPTSICTDQIFGNRFVLTIINSLQKNY